MSDEGTGLGCVLLVVVLVLAAFVATPLAINVGSRLLAEQIVREQPNPAFRPRPMPTFGRIKVTIPLYTPKPGFFVR
jgi:hypothetical protein